MHKKIFLSLLIGLFLITPFLTAEGGKKLNKSNAVEQIAEPIGYITYVKGEVAFQNFQRAEVDMLIPEGYELKTQRGKAEVYLGNGNFVRLNRNTSVVFITLEEGSVLLGLWNGSIYVSMNSGIVEVRTRHNESFVFINGMHRLDVGKKSTKDFKGERPIDRFASWNNSREKEINRSITVTEIRHLPYGLYDYYGWRWRGFWYGLYWWGPYSISLFWSPIYYHDYWYPRNYYRPGSRTTITTIRKNQLKRRNLTGRIPQNISKNISRSGKITTSNSKITTGKIYSSRIKSHSSRISSSGSRFSRSSTSKRLRISSSTSFSRFSRSVLRSRSLPRSTIRIRKK